MKDLWGKTAVVTGAAMGMGKCLASQLLTEGCKVALVDVNQKALDETVQELDKKGQCKAYIGDVSDREAVYQLAGKIEKDLGPVSILINNAGIVRAGSIIEMDDEIIEKIINVNLTSQFWTTKAFLPSMVKQSEGHIVNFASAGGILAIPWITAYCASKFGVVGFSDSLRQEMKKMKLNIGVTVVCPNTVNTGMFQGSKMVTGTSLLKPEDVTKRVVRAIKKNKPMVAVPHLAVRFITPLTKTLLPINAMDRLNKAMGMWDVNDTWTGRGC